MVDLTFKSLLTRQLSDGRDGKSLSAIHADDRLRGLKPLGIAISKVTVNKTRAKTASVKMKELESAGLDQLFQTNLLSSCASKPVLSDESATKTKPNDVNKGTEEWYIATQDANKTLRSVGRTAFTNAHIADALRELWLAENEKKPSSRSLSQ
ncbi:hypothetical protein C1H76_6591 [Elsinoe australis]|uniref:Uncharacterized protein n=1 Tax=Elsinoe australis TaxID=40998 RepID=A0A4U7AWA6_9PEZI|nr:hypothetical protein C1H76_6591 [Elsinoe australis]